MKTFSSWLREQFPFKVQKISIDAGFTCPNRDGSISTGGCTFCDNETFSPAYCRGELDFRENRNHRMPMNSMNPKMPLNPMSLRNPKNISEQIKAGKAFFARKYPEMKYLAYFQSFSNTYAPLERLKALYEEALAQPDIVGLVIGTRPDCVSPALLDYLAELAEKCFVLVEYGVESVNDETLKRVNRGHDFAISLRAIEETARRGINVGAHIILGLPGDNLDETIEGIRQMHAAGMTLLKLHQLQIIRGTRMAEEYLRQPFPLFSADEYIETIREIIAALPEDIIYDRFVSQSPPGKVLAPSWGLKNHEFTDRLENILKGKG